jgi:hypothetical protein
LLLPLLTELHAVPLSASRARWPAIIAGVSGSDVDLEVTPPPADDDGGDEVAGNGVRIFLKTSSRDISAASIPAQSPSALPLQLLGPLEVDALKFPYRATTDMSERMTLCCRAVPLLLRLSTTFSHSWLTCCLTVLAG